MLEAATNGTVLQLATSHQSGSPEVSARWLAEHRAAVRVVDVREPHELSGPLGAIDGAENVPLATLLERGLTAASDEAVVFVCRSGRRSALAVEAMVRRGHRTVASLEGGMLVWNSDVLGRTSVWQEERDANAQNLGAAIRTANGVPEVSVAWVRQNLGRFRLVDVRGADERQFEGLIPQAEHVPLGAILEAAKAWPKDAPLVIHCKAGGRSARATMALRDLGFSHVASMEGGMMGWLASAPR